MGRQLFLFVLPLFVQLQVVATNSALTELRDMKLVEAGAIESQDTQINVRKMIEGVCTLVGVNFRMWTLERSYTQKVLLIW